MEKRELEGAVIAKVKEVISAIMNAKHVDEVVCALHSIAALLFPLDSSLISGSIEECYRDKVLGVKIPSVEERQDWWDAFYRGVGFPTLARFLLLDVAPNWLGCFPISAQKHAYDVFFSHGLVSEVVQILVPFLQQNGSDGLDVSAVISNSEGLLVLCLLENNGMLQLAREFGDPSKSKGFTNERIRPAVSRVAQIVASIPDKARMNTLTLLSSHVFFKQIIAQLLSLAEERDATLLENVDALAEMDKNGALLFVGEMFSRISRRGFADLLSSELVPRVLRLVKKCFSSSNHSSTKGLLESNPEFMCWSIIMEAIRDPYTTERISEHILHQLATHHADDIQAYWVLWLLFHRNFKVQASIRSMFVDKFLLWKVFPITCLKWILQFAVHECPPGNSLSGHNHPRFSNVVERLLTTWSKKEFVQTAPIEQQAYISAALGLSLETMSKEELDVMKDSMHLILQGVSCRLESPNDLVRKMASNVALVFSKIIDPKNPLYLDDSCSGETIDWEFGFTALKKRNCGEKVVERMKSSELPSKDKDSDFPVNKEKSISVKVKKNILDFDTLDPDEIIDPASLNLESDIDDDDDDDDDSASENSYSSSDSSLQPYDLSDDYSDLKKNFSQLTDIVAALRKSDDAEGVERALDVAEKLIRASPDELKHSARDLTRTLVQVRCSDISLEGAEDSAEEKRQRALVALAVTSPFESLETLNKLLYSPNVDISQRIMILDVMTEAAQELAESKILKPKHPTRETSSLISVVSDTRPWFLPSNSGTPGASSWKEISGTGAFQNWSNTYERELPPKPNQAMKGKTRRWSLRSPFAEQNQMEFSQNKFPMYAAAFMLPAMEGYDKKRHGVDLLGRDFIVLGKLIYMLGICMKSVAMHPEASVLAPSLLDMLKSREVCHHKEAYVRRAVLFAASCVLVAVHPTYISSALLEGNVEIASGLEWIRTWALDVVDSDTDRECYMMAMKCLQLHAEMALQTSRALESAKSSLKYSPALPSDASKVTIKIPYLNKD
ncbi:hypothetical protein HN51_046035 [Arachis hypogaea]|uniref:telomere length regulation protein TEL2 homolog isoform X1 n=2 Tax=Arachis ipaensis TaxID=130454 RepID=UPI0007AF559E|nr:telomere length regulation protein TEL2 homolog isoform X1 [Arachis ipaensis]XP_025669396.1 telomere length regulation protein TEL2 homolog isoform X1 [Arachis hypogaea]QHN98311.1 uncharacterized protein DS421_18g634870 [Arachis hypogaea]